MICFGHVIHECGCLHFFKICRDFFRIFWAFYGAFCAYRPRLIRVAETDPSQCPSSQRLRPRLWTMYLRAYGWISSWIPEGRKIFIGYLNKHVGNSVKIVVDMEGCMEVGNYTHIYKIRLGEIKYALRKWKLAELLTHHDIPIADLKTFGELGTTWLIKLLNKIIVEKKCLTNGN